MADEKLETAEVVGIGAGNQVCFYEKDPAHPGGQAWVVADGKPVTVAKTPALLRAVAEGRVNWNSKPGLFATPEPTPDLKDDKTKK